ncbi:hypothetical protein [Streptomyces scabichelini]|nr:hypothetical protein [Streptomyces scabichelini]
MLWAALDAPAQLLGVRKAGEVVDGHDLSRQGELAARCGGG